MLRPKPNSRSDLFESLTGPTLHMSPGTAGAVTFIAEGAVALVAIGQVVASGPVVAGPGRALVDVLVTPSRQKQQRPGTGSVHWP